MPQFQLVDNDTGRQMVVESDTPPSESEVALLFQNYDAYKVTTAGPKGSEERRRAMAQEVAAQQALSTEDTESQRGRLSSAGQSAMRGGGEATGQSVSMLARIGDVLGRGGMMVGPGGAVPFTDPQAVSNVVEMSKQTPLEREQSIQQDPLYQAGQDISTGARLAYQPNPKYKGEFFTDVIPSSAGAMVPTIATAMVGGPIAAGVQYGLASGQQSAEEAIAAGRPETAQAASIATLPIGAVSEFGLGAAANIGKIAKLGAQRGALVAAGRVGAGESIQEGVEQVGQNLVASDVAGYDPNRAPFEGVPQAMGAGFILGSVIGGASAKISQANTTPDLLAGLSEKWNAIRLAAELSIAPQRATTIAPAQPLYQYPQVRGLSQAATDAGLNQFVEPSGQTPFDQFINRSRTPAPIPQSVRRAELEAGLTIPQDSGKLPSDEPQPPIPPRYAQAPQLATLGTAPRTQLTTSPIDEAILSGRLQRAALPPINPDLQRLQDAAEAELNAIERFPNRDTRRRDALLGAAPQVIQILDTRINNSIGTVSDTEVGRLMDLRERLARFYNDQTAYNQLTAEAIGIARDTRRPAPRMAAGLSQLEQSRQAQFPAGGAAVQPEQPQSILPQGDLMSRLRDARKMDVLRQPSPMSAAALGTGQPVGGPPTLNPMTDWLQVYEAAQNQVQTPAPLLDVGSVPTQPQAEAQAPQGDQVRQGPAARRVGRRVNLRAPKPQKSSQTTTGSNVQTGTEMPVQPPAGEAIDAATQAELQELDELMLKRGQAQNKVKGVSFTKKDETRFRELLEKNRGRILERVYPGADPVVGTDINGSPILQSASGTYYTFENGRVRTGPSFASAPLSRSEPAAAQGVATEGAGVSQEETPAFGVRRYGDARFISIAEYNRLRPQVDERIAAGDQVAKRIDELEINAEREVAKAAGFGALTPEGQEQSVGNFKTKLYQSVGKWLEGGEFEFSSAVIANSIASDIGKSKAERARKLTVSGESSEEGGEETLGAFDRASTQPALPLVNPKAPIKLQEETVPTLRNLQRQLGATITQFKNVLAAYSSPEMEAELDDAEVGMLEQARPTLARLGRINYSVAGPSPKADQGPFYSQLTRTIQSLPQETMTVGQARAAIEKGAKKDEIAMSEIFTDPLSPLYGKQPGDKVSKSDLIGYALERQATVEDVVLGGGPSDNSVLPEGARLSGPTFDGGWLVYSADGELLSEGRSQQEAIQLSHNKTNTRFSPYQIPGGDEGSYREIFVKWPESLVARIVSAKRSAMGGSWRIVFSDGYSMNSSGSSESEARLSATKSYGKYGNQSWRDGHKEYSDIANPIVRIRRNIRTDASGKKTYFIEEIQGPQKGQQEKMPPELRKRIYEIGMKRALRDAVDSGADAIAWTTGQQQADRYDLSKQVLHVAWEANDDGTYNINAPLPDGSPGVYEEDLSLDQVEELVGKDIAKKISAGEGRAQGKSGGYRNWKILEGVDLIGGEGLKRLYDQTLPSIANDLAKKFGVRVGSAKIDGIPGGAREMGDVLDRAENPDFRKLTVHSLTIPEEMKAAAKAGLPIFSISSLIREPIGRSRALQEVDKWKLETGAVGARIEVVEDPDLTTPDGRPVAAMVETRPGELPRITINAAHIASEEEVREKLWHEALHPVWGDGAVQAAWAEVLKTLPPAAVQAELARGYDPLEATMEAAINAASVQANNTPVRTAWQKFLDAVWEALSRVFGFETKPKDFERLMESALQSLSRPYNQSNKPGVLVASNAMVTAPGVSPDDYALTAHHGTPHKVDKFTTAKIGTGEGAQVYGYGLYFAENPAVGRQYAMNLGARDEAGNRIPGAMGNEYTVSLNVEPEDLLDWDRPLSEQGEKVRKAAMDAISQRIGFPFTLEQLTKNMGHSPTGAEVYNTVQTNNQRESSERLSKAGIRGIRYLDQGSRGPTPQDIKRRDDLRLEVKQLRETIAKNDGKQWVERKMFTDWLASSERDLVAAERVAGNVPKPTYNYVIFDENDITITHENGQVVKAGEATAPATNYSVANSFAMTRSPGEIQQRLETSSDPESLLAMGKAAASLITPEFQQLVASVEDAAPGTPEAAMRTFLRRAGQIAQTGEAVVEWGKTHETPIPAFRSIGDLPAEWQGVVGNAMTGAHFALGQQVRSIDRAIEKTADELTRVAADFSEADEKRLVAEATKSEAKRLLKDLLRLVELEAGKLGTSAAKATKEETDAAARMVSRVDMKLTAALANGIEIMAREMPIAGFSSNSDALAWLEKRQASNPIFGDKAIQAYFSLTEGLKRKPDLTRRIEQIRALTLDNVDAVREVGQLGKLLGKNKANTIRNYAKLRADYESAFRQFKSLSDRMDRLSNRMDGLLRAKEALVNLTTSPEYNAKLGEVFGNNKTMISGLMAPVTERGQPTGVIEFYGPSAYVANGGIKPGGKVAVYGDPGFEKADGLIYRIDWKPDFAIERKNVEAITGLIRELADALYNPESKNALKDPLARASYERVLNYVQKFLVDNRYLTEQQWKDSILLTGLKAGGIGAGLPGLFMQFAGSLYTTRMNAARASGGRGGAQWEEANKAVDTFEKKSENTLRDTRTENAEARRAAIESHGLNPDDPMAIEEWSAHISSVIGSMQNPSQDQLKEGDYVGGMQVTKEDLRSARIQKQFSSGIVSDFNNMATSFAEVVNPEEEIGGILFTRAAEDYGMKTRREFSQWGREFADRWQEATEADLRAFRAKQANATGDEQVQMVWDEREKLANEKIEGPVYGHIAETNSEFTSKDSNQLKAAFSRIRKALKAGRTEGLQTVDGIASAISELTADENGEGGLNPLEAKVELLQAIDRDVAGYRRATNEFDQSGLGGSNLPDAIMSVKAANGALALARGKMVAPTWFYDYGIHDDYKRAAEVANGKRILLMKVYETMTAYRNAVKRKLEDAKREIRENASKMGRDGRPVGLARAEKEYDKKSAAQYKEGGVFATRKMLEATLKLVEGQLDGLKGHLASSSGFVAEVTLGVRALKSFLGGWASFLLSSGNSIINNLTSTTLDTYRTWDTTNRFWLKVFAIAKANGRLIRFIASDILFASLPSSIKRSISKRQKSALLDTVSKILEGSIGERLLMEEMGQIQSFESLDSIRRRLRANPLTFGVTRTPSNSAIERGAAWLYNKAAFAMALGSWVRERSPGYFDGLLNRTIATDATAFVEWLTPHLLSWARSQPGETVEEKIKSALESTLTPESIGVTTEGLALIRDYMRGYGSLENLAAKSLSDNGLDGLKVPNSLTNEEMKAIQFDAGRKYNIRASSTTPDYAKGGAGIKGVASNVLHMFMGWVLQRMGSDANQFFKTKGGGAKKEWEVVWKALMLVLVTLMAGALYKIPKDIWRAITGNPATTPNILQAVDSPEMALRYLAASTAGVFPVGGGIAAELLGGSGISSPLNNNFLDNNPAAGFLASLLATGKRVYQTGDLKYPLVDFTRKNFWPAGVVMNYTMPGDVEARGAARAVRMGATGMEVRPTGGGVGARETPATPLVRDAVAALYEGDSAAYQQARQKFIAYQVRQGKTQREAEKRFDSSVSGRDPLRSVLGRQPTEEEEATILRRLTPGQRKTVTKARSLFRKPKKVRLGGARKSRRIRLGRRRPARRSVRLRRSAS